MNVCASGTTVYTETIREICCGINISNDGIIQEAESQIGRLTSCLFLSEQSFGPCYDKSRKQSEKLRGGGLFCDFWGAALKHSPEFSSQTLFISFFQKQSRSLVQKKSNVVN